MEQGPIKYHKRQFSAGLHLGSFYLLIIVTCLRSNLLDTFFFLTRLFGTFAWLNPIGLRIMTDY